MQRDRLGDGPDIVIQPLKLACYPRESLMNEPFDGRCRIEEALESGLHHHALANAGTVGGSFQSLEKLVSELDGDLSRHSGALLC